LGLPSEAFAQAGRRAKDHRIAFRTNQSEIPLPRLRDWNDTGTGFSLASESLTTRGTYLFFRPKVREEEFEAATMAHFPALYRTARLLAQESAEAEDLVQEVYLEAWKSFHRFEKGTNCRAWLFKILFHRLHHFRRRWAKAVKVEPLEKPEDQDNIMAEAPVPQEIRDEDVLEALGKVPIEFREVVLLADVQEFSYKEIAETMKLPLGTVMSRLSRGRKLLRQELAHVAGAYGIRLGNNQARTGESA
jgi:RNA polymerase sigma-70 factor (ECF subfamily)